MEIENWKFNRWVLSHLILLGIIVLSVIQLFSINNQRSRIDVLDVGQGDAILIQTPEYKNILIDAGEGGQVIEKLSDKINFFNNAIDLAIITHPHNDHFGGFLDVIQKYPIKQIMLTGAISDDPLYASLLNEIKSRKIPIIFPENDRDLQIGQNTYLDIIYPFTNQSLIGQTVKNPNDVSIVMKLTTDRGPKILLAGDAEQELEEEILLNGQNVSSPVLKTGHHGSKTATSDNFLAAIKPQTAVISAGKENKFGHPHIETIEKLKELNVLQTAVSGTIEFNF